MARGTVPIPGKILQRSRMSLAKELVQVMMIPVPLLIPASMLGVMEVGIAAIVVCEIPLVILVLQSPEGQRTGQWLLGALQRRFGPGAYTLRPKAPERPPMVHLDVVQTARGKDED